MNPDQHDPADPCGATRRVFLQEAAAAVAIGGLLAPCGARAAVKAGLIEHVQHVVIDDDRNASCGSPRQCGIKDFGGGELAVLYWRRTAPSGLESSRGRAEAILDGGQTWPAENEVHRVVQRRPLGKAGGVSLPRSRPTPGPGHEPAGGHVLLRAHADPRGANRQEYEARLDLRVEARPAWHPSPAPFSRFARSTRDAPGRRVPLVLDPPPRTKSIWRDNHPLVAMPDGALVGAMESEGAIWLYGSENQGMTWQYLSLIAMEKAGAGKPCCAGLVLLPNGRLQCYLLMLGEPSDTLCLSESDDGFRWSHAAPDRRAMCTAPGRCGCATAGSSSSSPAGDSRAGSLRS